MAGISYCFLRTAGGFFVAQDDAFEIAEGIGLIGRNLHLADDVFAFAVKQVGLGGYRGAIAGERHVDFHGVGNFIDSIAGGNGDIEAVMPVAGGIQVNGEGYGACC